MKKIVSTFIVMAMFFIVGCGTSRDEQAVSSQQNSSIGETVSTTSALKTESSDVNTGSSASYAGGSTAKTGSLAVEIMGDKEATFVITSDSLMENFQTITYEDTNGSGCVYEWGVEFGDFYVRSFIPYIDGIEDYNSADLQGSISYLEPLDDGSCFIWGITSLDVDCLNNTVTIHCILPELEQMAMLDSADAEILARYTFSQPGEYKLIEKEKGREVYSLYFSAKEVAITNTTELIKMFPADVYSNGFVPAQLDASCFNPTTGNYILYDGTKINPDGLIGVDRKILLVLDESGSVIDGYTRMGYFTGAESSPQGVVPVVADQETMSVFLNEFIEKGYEESTENTFLPGTVVMKDWYLYCHWNQEMLNHLNENVVYSEYLSAAEWIENTPEAILNNLEAADYGSGYKKLYASEFVIDNSIAKIENYCNEEEFQYLHYIPQMSDDYYIIEFVKSADIYFFDENDICSVSYNIQEIQDKKSYNNAIAMGFDPVEGSSTLVIHCNQDNSTPKKITLKNFIFTLTNYQPLSYDNSMENYGYSLYMSEPWLNH